MKSIALISCCIVLSACGNWSNDDLEFLNAMPDREALRAKVPTATAGGLAGEGTRRDALAIGERSKLYTDTKAASDTFNDILTFLLGAIDYVRSLPPTSRTTDSRTWGPYNDPKNPGFQVRVTIVKVTDARFTYAIQHRPSGGAYVDTVTGEFIPTAKLAKGSGGLVIHAANATQLQGGAGFANLEKIEMAYATEQFPITVVMKATSAAGLPSASLTYGYRENSDQSGGIGFSQITTDPNISQLDTGTAWLASGAGYGGYKVVAGNYKDATHFECWDASFNTIYVKQTWPGGADLGDPAACVTVSGFPKP